MSDSKSGSKDNLNESNMPLLEEEEKAGETPEKEVTMVFIIDGCSLHYAHTWSKSGILFCLRHLVTSKES